MQNILTDKYNDIVANIENHKNVCLNEFLFLLARGEENDFADEFRRKKIEIKNEEDFIKSVVDPTTDNYTSWVEINGNVYIDIHLPGESPKAIKVNIQNIESLSGADPVEYKLLTY